MTISSLTLDKEELHDFCRILQERSKAAGEIEVRNYQKGNLTDDQFLLNTQTIRDGFDLRIGIAGLNGENLWGPIEEVFTSVNFPNNVKSLFVDSETTLKVGHNYSTQNSIQIFLDFSKPQCFDLNLLPSQKTPNESNIKVQGNDATWVNGVFAELKKFIDSRSSFLSLVHTHSIYDVLMWILGFPFAFWACFKLSPIIEAAFPSHTTLVINALYLYTFAGSLILFRFLFHYLRWVCPLVEYRAKHSKAIVHRLLFSSIILSILSSFAYDLIKLIRI